MPVSDIIRTIITGIYAIVVASVFFFLAVFFFILLVICPIAFIAGLK